MTERSIPIVSQSDVDEAIVGDRLSRKLALWEICSVVTSGLIAEWVGFSFVGRSKVVAAIPVLLAIGWMVYSHRERDEDMRDDLGMRMHNFWSATGLLILPTVAVIALILLVGWRVNHVVFAAPWRDRFIFVPFWALFQQYVLNGFINRRAQIALGPGWKSVTLVAVIFAVFHLPNPGLAALTFAGGFVWAAVYQRRPNLIALTVSHTLISVTLALTLSPNLLNGSRVGFKYFGMFLGY